MLNSRPNHHNVLHHTRTLMASEKKLNLTFENLTELYKTPKTPSLGNCSNEDKIRTAEKCDNVTVVVYDIVPNFPLYLRTLYTFKFLRLFGIENSDTTILLS